VRDATLRTGAPLDQLAKARRELDLLALWPGAAPSGDGDVLHTQGLELRLHRRFAIAAVGGDRLGDFAEELGHAGDGRSEHGRIGRVAQIHEMVENDALGVVGDLGLVTELDGPAKTSLADGAGVGDTLTNGLQVVSGEAAAWQVANVLGFEGIVGGTVLRPMYSWKTGTVGAVSSVQVIWPSTIQNQTAANVPDQDGLKAGVFDYVINNTDRGDNGHNWGVTEQTTYGWKPGVKLWDNANA